MTIRRLAFGFAVFAVPAGISAQGAQMSGAEVRQLATVHFQISAVHDSINAQLAQARNKTAAAQQELRDKLRAQVSQILRANNLSDSVFQRRRLLVSADGGLRRQFDSAFASLTGAPLPGQIATPTPVAQVPSGPVGEHLGHIVNSFDGAPNKLGLLPTALTEARVAILHADLAEKSGENLESLKLHAGHVLMAIDPAAMGSTSGYGFRKAGEGVVQHIGLAAAIAEASANVKTHATHVATAMQSALARAEQITALGKQIRESSNASAALSLTRQLSVLCQQLVSGIDVNADGRIGWDKSEGGIQQAQEHMTLLLRGEVR